MKKPTQKKHGYSHHIEKLLCHFLAKLTVVYRVRFEAVEFKEAPTEGHVADKVEGFLGAHGDSLLFLRLMLGFWSADVYTCVE